MNVKEAIDVLERNCDFHYEETDKCYGCKFENSGWCDEDFHDSLLTLLKEQEQAMKEKDGTIRNLIAQIKEISQYYERVVLCKDCKNWIPGYITDQDDFIPPKCGKYQQMVGHSNDDFCSLAEKKEGR